jgi:multiple sugar transport system substrate-binding protein
MIKRSYIIHYVLILFAIFLQTACSDSVDEPHFVQTELEMWLHYGSETERRTIQQQVARYNSLQDNAIINAVILPQGKYHEQVSNAAANGRLPDILEVDPGYIGFRAWRKQLRPIDKLLSDSVRGDLLLPVLQQGIYQGRLYAVSPESRIALVFMRKSALKAAGISEIGPDTWTLARFYQVIARLQGQTGEQGLIELKRFDNEQDLSDEILPLVYASESISGNDVAFVDRLTGSSTRELFHFFQNGFQKGYFDRHKDDSFLTGEASVALGSQADIATYQRAWQDDLLVLPMPGAQRTNFMFHSGWSLGITHDCRDEQLAVRFIEFLLQPEEVMIMAKASDTLPGTYSALGMSESPATVVKSLFSRIQSAETEQTMIYTSTPAYPQLRARFYRLFQNIARGEDVSTELVEARNDMTTILRQYQVIQTN